MLNRPFDFLPIQVLPKYESGPWEVNHEFENWELWALLYLEPWEGAIHLPFSFCYSKRWLELSQVDSSGKHWLISGKSIRTPVIKWCKAHNIYPVILPQEITFPNSREISFE